MIGSHWSARRTERIGQLVRAGARLDIHNTGARGCGDEIGDLFRRTAARAHRVANIRPVEPGEDEAVMGNAELGEDVGTRMGVGCRGKRKARDMAKPVE